MLFAHISSGMFSKPHSMVKGESFKLSDVVVNGCDGNCVGNGVGVVEKKLMVMVLVVDIVLSLWLHCALRAGCCA